MSKRGFHAALLVAAAIGCGQKASSVAAYTEQRTRCAPDQLAVFNYDRDRATWNAVCGDQFIACSGTRNDRDCSVIPPIGVKPELRARAGLLLELPQGRRSYYIERNLEASPWQEFAREVVVLRSFTDSQYRQVKDTRLVFTGFSAAFDAQLRQCVGAEGLAAVAVSKQGTLKPVRNIPCLHTLAASPELAKLHQHPGYTFQLAVGVRDLKLPEQPGREAAPEQAQVAQAEAAAQAEAEAARKEREALAAIHEWLDAAQPGLQNCTGLKEIPVDVTVDENGAASVVLQGKLNTKNKAACVRHVMGEKQFPPGARAFSYVIGAPKVEPALDEAAASTEPVPPPPPSAPAPAAP